ncbi:MAG TPA: ankyrin repeat domain-containing protein [Bryobacteraceae bacterium]|nr:ankyrin repeat domain-containing protein [Bryobacteraceae bacterium]
MNMLEAIKSGDSAGAAKLLESDPSVASERTAEGVSYISLAMYHRQPEIARLLAAKRTDLDLPEACAVGEIEHVRRLISSDANAVNRFSSDGFAPVALAAFFGHSDIVEALVAAGADVNAQAQNPMKVAAIHAAVASRDARSVEFLLRNGADPNLPQQDGLTPLHAAQMSNDERIIRLLMEAGARS